MDRNIAVHELINRVEEYIYKAEVSENPEQSDAALASARELAERCVQVDPNNTDCWFIAGLAMYQSFEIDEAYKSLTEAYLKRSLSLDDQHQFARLYLGHYYYDIGKYEHALSNFEKVTDKYFLLADKKWRVLKLHELILCCKLRLDCPDVSIDSFISLIHEFDDSLQEDVPVPLELAVTLVETKGNPIWQRVKREQVLKTFLSFIKKQGFEETLQYYITAF